MSLKHKLPIIAVISISSLLILTHCSKSHTGGTASTTSSSTGKVKSLDLGNAPDTNLTPVTDPPTIPVDLHQYVIVNSSMTNTMTSAFNALAVNLPELSLEMGLPATITAGDIDFDNLYVSYDNNDPGGQAITALFKSNSNSVDDNYGFTLYSNGTCYGKPTFTRSHAGQFINFFDAGEGLITTLSNYTSANFSITTSPGNFLNTTTSVSTSRVRTQNIAGRGCGQATANCLADVYANHGWVSVWAFVQTAFVPTTAVALAAACAAKNCLMKYDICP